MVGESGIGPAVLYDQLGSFLPLAVGGALIVPWGKGEGVSWSSIVAKLVTFPPTIALVLALLLRSVTFHPTLLSALGTIAATLSPVALFAVGLAAARPALKHVRPIGAGLVWKLVLPPLGVFGMAAWLNTDPHWAHVTVLQSAMAPMVTGGIVASSAGLNPELASQMVVLGLFASAVTLPLWNLMF